MVKMSVTYQGDLHCELVHQPSGSHIETDAPKDNKGRGERFSPTDLMGAALGSCILTTIAILGSKDGIEITGAKADVEKVMTTNPRRVDSLTVILTLPASLNADQRKRVQEIAEGCPVHKSMHPDVRMPITYNYV